MIKRINLPLLIIGYFYIVQYSLLEIIGMGMVLIDLPPSFIDALNNNFGPGHYERTRILTWSVGYFGLPKFIDLFFIHILQILVFFALKYRKIQLFYISNALLIMMHLLAILVEGADIFYFRYFITIAIFIFGIYYLNISKTTNKELSEIE